MTTTVPHPPAKTSVRDRLLRLAETVTTPLLPADYLDLVAQKFFTTRDQLLIGNPDLTGSMELVEGDELCVLPPVCAVECKHGLDCSPPSASTAL